MSFAQQIERIRTKFGQVREVDGKSLRVFGAGSHRYELDPPLAEIEVAAFEKEHGIALPAAYRAFLTEFAGKGAGPYYGLYSLGVGLGEVGCDTAGFLALTPRIDDTLEVDEWEASVEVLESQDDVLSVNEADAAWERWYRERYGGTLILGTQGCAIFHALIISGQAAGRVCYYDSDSHVPFLCYEDNFLDWYERWLDEILDGSLTQNKFGGFATTLAGSAEHLLDLFDVAEDEARRLLVLRSLTRLPSLEAAALDSLERLAQAKPGAVRAQARMLLAKYDFGRARRFLLEQVGQGDEALLASCQAYHWYAREEAEELASLVRPRLDSITDPTTLSLALNVLEDTGQSMRAELVTLARKPDANLRRKVFHSMTRAPVEDGLIPLLLAGFSDEDPANVHAALQASRRYRSDEILEGCRAVARRFPENVNSIHSNLDGLARSYGLAGREALLADDPDSGRRKNTNWQRLKRWFRR